MTYRKDFINFWRENELDFIVAPGYVCPAVQHGKAVNLTILPCAYTYMWNALDIPSCAMPVTLCKEDENYYESVHNDVITDTLKEVMTGAENLPMGVQVVSLPFQEEKILGLISSIEKDVGFYQKHPLPKI